MPKSAPTFKPVCYRLPVELIERLRVAAFNYRQSQTSIVIQALEEWMVVHAVLDKELEPEEQTK